LSVLLQNGTLKTYNLSTEGYRKIIVDLQSEVVCEAFSTPDSYKRVAWLDEHRQIVYGSQITVVAKGKVISNISLEQVPGTFVAIESCLSNQGESVVLALTDENKILLI
jgi:hypothetical protein